MAKVGLDAICAKLSRHAEMTSRKVDSSSPYCDNDSDSGGGAATDKTAAVETAIDEQYQVMGPASASLPPSESVDAMEHNNMMVTGNELVTLRPGDGATSLVDSGYGEEAAFDGDFMDDSAAAGAGRRSRRKNFLPRCVQDGLAVVEQSSEPRQTADAATASTTTWSAAVESVEDDQAALDLRVGRNSPSLTRQASNCMATHARKPGDDTQDHVLDLSVPRCARGALGDSDQRDSSESRMTGWTTGRQWAAGELNSADMRIYAVNTMTELLHIYGLPDEHQSAVTDSRKWVLPVENRSDTETPTFRGIDPSTQFDVTGSAGRIQDREQVMTTSSVDVPDCVVGQTRAHATELTRVKGTVYVMWR